MITKDLGKRNLLIGRILHLLNMNQMTDDNKVIYSGTANPNATNSELDAKIIIHHTNKDGNRDLKGKENEKEAKASS